jgi:decaprenyl-phosphate phosphoribosyltransferase
VTARDADAASEVPGGAARGASSGRGRALPGGLAWLAAVVRTTRPRQWPKNLLVFAAPLAGATLGRPGGFGYALLAAAAFGFASAAVYLVNDVTDAGRDRLHPAKRNRPVASGALPGGHALALAASAACCALAAGIVIAEPLLVAAAAGYLCSSLLYSARLKHVPYLEMVLVASGFLLRVLGGAAATHVRPSTWFLLVCSLGALGVAIAKRYTELTSLGEDAARHRPVLRWYRPAVLRAAQAMVAVMMLATYMAWALGESAAARAWHLGSLIPLALALGRFGMLTARRSFRQVEDMITRDGPMIAFELAWLGLFCTGLYMGG